MKARAARHRYERWLEERAEQRSNSFDALYAKWECIHLHEGAWNDPNPPYWGGLQMDWGFQSFYGGEFMRQWGTADNWPVWAQLTAAERAYHGYNGERPRGFGPWPNTRRMCGV